MKERVRGIIVEEGKIIVIKRVKKGVTYWAYPGGGVEKGEDVISALKREMKEELGVEIEVQDLFIEYLFERPETGVTDKEYFYFCKITGGELGTGDGPEYQDGGRYDGTHAVDSLELSKIKEFDLRPKEITEKLLKHLNLG